jgi:4-hydroxy-2-oxoheptanedioate aldolase
MTPVLDLSATRRGIFVKLPSTQVIDLAVVAGFDFVIVDLEHSQLDFRDAAAMVGRASISGLPALVRLPDVNAGAVNRLLEAGAVGIQLSTVTSAEQVHALRRAMDYAPVGGRSIGTAHRLARYGKTPLADYVDSQHARPPLAVIQIETPTTASPIVDIANAGADVLFVGQADLTVAFEFDGDRVATRVHEIIEEARSADLAIGGIRLPDGLGTYDVVGADIGLLGDAFDRAL